MEALLSSFGVVFLAEMGDKTQLLVMAFAAKYHWRPVLGGMFLGILAVHSLAVAAGNVVGSYLSPELMQGLAGAGGPSGGRLRRKKPMILPAAPSGQ